MSMSCLCSSSSGLSINDDIACVVDVALDVVDSTASLACCCALHSIVM